MEHLPPVLMTIFDAVGGPLGLSTSFAAFLVLQVANLFIAMIFKQIRNGSVRKITSLCIGLTWSFILYDAWNTALLILISGIFYILPLLNILSPSKITILAVAILSYFHISRMITDYMGWSLDVSGPLMLFTAKYTMFAFDLSDGRLHKSGKPLSPELHVANARNLTCINQTPSLLEYYAFIFDFLGFVAGPVFHIREYLDFMYLRGDFLNLDSIHFIRIVGERFFYAICIGGMFSIAGTVPQLEYAYIETPDYVESSLWWKCVIIHVMTSANRLRYYFAWYMSDVACLLSGMGYSPKNRDKFSRGQNAIISKVDFANCQAEALSHWNISIAKWLRNCIYLRASESEMPKILKGLIGHRQYATLLTRFTSAFWHGFYPGYYMAFFSTVLQFETDTLARKFIKPIFMKEGATKPHWIYTFGGKIHTAWCLNYYGATFLILAASTSMYLWNSMFFIVHIMNIASIVLIPIVCKKVFNVNPVSRTPVEKKTE